MTLNPKPHILLVDDDVHFGKLLTIQLARANFQVTVVTDGLQALDWLASGHLLPDLILLDLLLPRYSGLEVMAKIQLMAGPIPILLMSAAQLSPAQLAVPGGGPTPYLLKPFEFPALLAAIQQRLASGDASQIISME